MSLFMMLFWDEVCEDLQLGSLFLAAQGLDSYEHLEDMEFYPKGINVNNDVEIRYYYDGGYHWLFIPVEQIKTGFARVLRRYQ